MTRLQTLSKGTSFFLAQSLRVWYGAEQRETAVVSNTVILHEAGLRLVWHHILMILIRSANPIRFSRPKPPR